LGCKGILGGVVRALSGGNLLGGSGNRPILQVISLKILGSRRASLQVSKREGEISKNNLICEGWAKKEKRTGERIWCMFPLPGL